MKSNYRVGALHAAPDFIHIPVGANCIRPIKDIVKMVVLPIDDNRYR